MTESRDYFPLSVKILVGVKGLEPPASCSQSRRATNCATPRYAVLARMSACQRGGYGAYTRNPS